MHPFLGIELPQLHGQLVKTSEPSQSNKVWMINEFGHKVGVPDGILKSVFNVCDDDIKTLPSHLCEIREDDCLSNNAIIAKADDTETFLISNGIKRVIADNKTVDRFHFNLDAAVVLPLIAISSIPSGKPIQYPDQALRRFRKRGKSKGHEEERTSKAKSAKT